MKPRAWAKRPKLAPWTPEETARLVDMVGCGLTVDAYKGQFPDRPFGDILDRRLSLVEAGAVSHPRAL